MDVKRAKVATKKGLPLRFQKKDQDGQLTRGLEKGGKRLNSTSKGKKDSK
jgi:hypothetical protein